MDDAHTLAEHVGDHVRLQLGSATDVVKAAAEARSTNEAIADLAQAAQKIDD